MQVFDWQGEELGEGAVVTDDSEHAAALAVVWSPGFSYGWDNIRRFWKTCQDYGKLAGPALTAPRSARKSYLTVNTVRRKTGMARVCAVLELEPAHVLKICAAFP